METRKPKAEGTLARLMRRPWPDWSGRVLLYLSGQWISMLGSAMVQYAIIWYILRTTDSGLMMAAAAVCSFLPEALIAPWAEAWAERYDRRKLIIGADASIAAATLAMAVLFLLGRGEMASLLLLTALRSVCAGIQAPAVEALLPRLTPSESLTRVREAVSGARAFIVLIPPVISAWMMVAAPFAWVLFVDVLTAVVGIALLLLVRAPRDTGPDAEAGKRPWRVLRQGLRCVRETRSARLPLLFYGLVLLLIAPAPLLAPLMVQRDFGRALWRLPVLEVAYGLGALFGGALAGGRAVRQNRARVMAFGAGVLGVLTVALGLPMGFVWRVVALALIGAWVPMFSAPCAAMLEACLPADRAASVFALARILAALCLPLGMVCFGPLADAIPLRTLFITVGAAISVVSGFMTYSKTMTRAGTPPDAPPVESASSESASSESASPESASSEPDAGGEGSVC